MKLIMKSNVLVFFATISFLFISSCSSDDLIQNQSINGTWYLKKYDDSTNGININFVREDVKWNFDENTNKLTVEFNFSETTLENNETLHVGLDSGSYDYSLTEKNGIKYLVIGNQEFGSISIETNTLNLNKNVDSNGSGIDLFIWEFEK